MQQDYISRRRKMLIPLYILQIMCILLHIKEVSDIQCPNCRKARLEAVYQWMPPSVYHLDSERPSRPRRELLHIVCPGCGGIWYTLAGDRIQKEEPRP